MCVCVRESSNIYPRKNAKTKGLYEMYPEGNSNFTDNPFYLIFSTRECTRPGQPNKCHAVVCFIKMDELNENFL